MEYDNQQRQGPSSPPHEADRPAEQTSKKPSHTALSVNEGKDGKAHFNRVGAAFRHKDGKGYNLDLQAMPVNGKIVMREYIEKLKNGERTAPQQRQGQSQDYER